jgi:formylglycine-generating enzyme required for sulfatase activity
LWVTPPKTRTHAPGPARHNLCGQGDGTTDEAYPKSTCPVGSYHAGDTPSGISDLAGDVWEWTSTARTPPDGDPLYTLKGGGFGYDRLGPLEVRTSDSREYEADFFGPDIGFRCVQDSPRTQN